MYCKNTNCLTRDSKHVPFQRWGWDRLVQTALPTCLMVWCQIWLLGPQFPHLYHREMDPIVSKILPHWHQVTRNFTVRGSRQSVCLGSSGSSLQWWGFTSDAVSSERVGTGPRAMEWQQNTPGALGAGELSCFPEDSLTGPQKPSGSPSLRAIRANAGIGAG